MTKTQTQIATPTLLNLAPFLESLPGEIANLLSGTPYKYQPLSGFGYSGRIETEDRGMTVYISCDPINFHETFIDPAGNIYTRVAFKVEVNWAGMGRDVATAQRYAKDLTALTGIAVELETLLQGFYYRQEFTALTWQQYQELQTTREIERLARVLVSANCKGMRVNSTKIVSSPGFCSPDVYKIAHGGKFYTVQTTLEGPALIKRTA